MYDEKIIKYRKASLMLTIYLFSLYNFTIQYISQVQEGEKGQEGGDNKVIENRKIKI